MLHLIGWGVSHWQCVAAAAVGLPAAYWAETRGLDRLLARVERNGHQEPDEHAGEAKRDRAAGLPPGGWP